jgi:hypothetical protein
MPFPTTPIIDDFNRADENPIGGNWTNNALGEGADNQLRIVSNQLKAVTAATSCEMYWNKDIFNGQIIEAYFTVITKPGTSQRFSLGFLQNPGVAGQWDGYQAAWQEESGTDSLLIERVDNSAGTTLASTTVEFNANDVIGFSRSSSGVFTVWQNGVSVLSSSADTTYTGGFYLSVTIRDTTGVIDNVGGGVSQPPVAWITA